MRSRKDAESLLDRFFEPAGRPLVEDNLQGRTEDPLRAGDDPLHRGVGLLLHRVTWGSVRSDFTMKFSSLRPAARVAFARRAASSAPDRGMSTRYKTRYLSRFSERRDQDARPVRSGSSFSEIIPV
jgi:hypothetical protein